MSTQASGIVIQAGNNACAPAFIRLWRDKTRQEQRLRIGALHLQVCDREGLVVWEQAYVIHAQLPKGMRIDLPSPRVFARLLGLFRSVAMLKFRPMEELQLSAAEIARALNYSKSIVEAALRWLGTAPIIYRGQQVARGLGYIARERRTARAVVAGVLKSVYRTSCTALTLVGRSLVGLGKKVAAGKAFARPRPTARRKTTPPAAACDDTKRDSAPRALGPNIREVIANAWKKIDPAGERHTEKDKRRARAHEPPSAENGWGRRDFVRADST